MSDDKALSLDAGQRLASIPVQIILVCAMAICFGALGVLMSCYSGVMTTFSLMGSSGPLPTTPEAQAMQAELLEVMWWGPALSMGLLFLYMISAVSLLLGGLLTLGQRIPGPKVLRFAFIYGAIYEVLGWVLTQFSTYMSADLVQDAMHKMVSADPNMDSAIADAVVPFYQVLLIATAVLMGLWALLKIGLYVGSLWVMRSDSVAGWLESFGEEQ